MFAYIFVIALLMLAAYLGWVAFSLHVQEKTDAAYAAGNIAGYNEAMYRCYDESVNFRTLGMIGSGNGGRVTVGFSEAISLAESNARMDAMWAAKQEEDAANAPKDCDSGAWWN